VIVQLVYASEPCATSRIDIQDLLVRARARNQQLHVTGFLAFHGGMFLQVLEGSASVVTALYNRIANDARHANIVLLGYERPIKRSFTAWAMGYVANVGANKSLLSRYSANGEFCPYDTNHRSAIEFLSEVAEGANTRAAPHQ
jgi:hypothetical protein